MNKKAIVARVSKNTGISKKETEKIVTETFNAIVEGLAEGEKIMITGFGTFDLREHEERSAINPKTKLPVVVPAARVPRFKASKAFKDSVRAKK